MVKEGIAYLRCTLIHTEMCSAWPRLDIVVASSRSIAIAPSLGIAAAPSLCIAVASNVGLAFASSLGIAIVSSLGKAGVGGALGMAAMWGGRLAIALTMPFCVVTTASCSSCKFSINLSCCLSSSALMGCCKG